MTESNWLGVDDKFLKSMAGNENGELVDGYCREVQEISGSDEREMPRQMGRRELKIVKDGRCF